jgi:hypothetical protein
VFLGKEFGHRDFHSEDMARIVDSEIREIIHVAHDRALDILRNRQDILAAMAERLLEAETLNVDEIYGMILGMVTDEEKEAVSARYQRALEMKIDTDGLDESTDVKKSEDSPEPAADPEGPDTGTQPPAGDEHADS